MAKKTKLTLPKGTKIPDHIAIIPDGNRRWARAKGLPAFEGHRRGINRAVEVSRAARDLGIHTVTLWGFSTENWDRTKDEINYLMKLYEKLVDDYLKEAKREGVRIYHLGRKDRLPKSLLKKLTFAEDSTKKNTKHIMNIALDYGGQDDIVRAAQAMVSDGVKPEKVDKGLFEKYIDTRGQPFPYIDLIIRTSGEQRTSGFLLWQSAYSETYWENDHFPDFTPEKLKAAILDYSRRRRRFGGNDAVEHFVFDPKKVAKLEIAWWKLKRMPKGTRMRDYVFNHLKKQFGLSTKLAAQAGNYLIEGLIAENGKKDLDKAKAKMKKFYKLIKEELKLAFDPSTLASLQVRLWEDLAKKSDPDMAAEATKIARELYAEMYRISLFQATKAAGYMVAASLEGNLAEQGLGEEHWKKAEAHLVKFYSALKERVA